MTRVLWLTDEQPQVYQCKNDITDVAGAFDAPVLQHDFGGYAKALQREFATCVRELRTSNVPAFGEARLAMLKRGEHEQVRALVKARFPSSYLLHDAVAKSQLGHGRFCQVFEWHEGKTIGRCSAPRRPTMASALHWGFS
jgi:hypothetical protein